MLRITGYLSIATILVICFSQYASADEYGARFYNNTPAGMAEFTLPSETVDIAMDDVNSSDNMDNIASNLQNIMPAAGEELNSSSGSEVVENIDKEQDSAVNTQ